MSRVILSVATADDGPELIRAHTESRVYHAPWTHTFTDEAGFGNWIGQMDAGNQVGLIARLESSRDIVGLCTLSQIARGAFQSAYLGFHGMVGYARRGLMTEAV